jgi:hypothetical protein
VAILGCALLACSRDSGRARHDAPAAAAEQSYEPGEVDDGGTIRGIVELTGSPPADTVIHAVSDQPVCGDTFSLPLFESDGHGLGGAVVWLADARRGKPLPVERRYTLTNERCLLVPRVQGVVAGGTLNVRSIDAAVHRNRFLRAGTDSVLAKIQLNDEGQVVPVEQVLSIPGELEVRCDQHPWTRAWLMVFDHPYFTTTTPDGAFRIDSIPPGEYQLVVWHPRLGTKEESVKVEDGRERDVRIKLGQ